MWGPRLPHCLKREMKEQNLICIVEVKKSEMAVSIKIKEVKEAWKRENTESTRITFIE